jgi:hypothetical protein
MRKFTVTTKSPEQIEADFDAIFKEMSPARGEAPTLEQRMKPYRKQILKLRKRGLSWNQIATGMGQPPVNEKISSKTLRALFGETEGKTAGTVRDPQPPTSAHAASSA